MSKPQGKLEFGRCEEVLANYPDNHFNAVITDPPYGLSASPDMHEVLRAWNRGEHYTGDNAGFMGRDWDSFVPGPNIWEPIMRTLQPGGRVLSFSGTRTYDLMVAAMDIAAEKHDCRLTGYHSWAYGSGFPKSHDISKAIDKKFGAEREVVGQKAGNLLAVAPGMENDRSQCSLDITAASTAQAKLWEGYGTALKPAHEPVAEYTKGGGPALTPESLFHYVPKPSGKERDKGCKALCWLMDGDDTKALTKSEYNALKEENEARKDEEGFEPYKVSTGNVWPTVKPIDLMRSLIRATMVPGRKNVILEPFMGSGTTVCAAILEGCDYVGIDADPVAFKISSSRVRYFKCLGEFGLK